MTFPVLTDSNYPIIAGKVPHSWPEVYFALALMEYKIPFLYQYQIGNNRVRGVLVVDFVITRPFYQAVEIFGEYWHSGQYSVGDKLKLEIQRRYFGRETIVVWSDQLPDPEAAKEVVRKLFL